LADLLKQGQGSLAVAEGVEASIGGYPQGTTDLDGVQPQVIAHPFQGEEVIPVVDAQI
jgi:hypothetical protein